MAKKSNGKASSKNTKKVSNKKPAKKVSKTKKLTPKKKVIVRPLNSTEEYVKKHYSLKTNVEMADALHYSEKYIREVVGNLLRRKILNEKDKFVPVVEKKLSEKEQYVKDNYATQTFSEMAKHLTTSSRYIRDIEEKLLGLKLIDKANRFTTEKSGATNAKEDSSSKQKVKTGLERIGEHVMINWTAKTVYTDLGEFGDVLIPFDMHNAIQRTYVTMGEGKTAADVATIFGEYIDAFIHAKAVHLYAKHHGFTKSSTPQTDIEFKGGLTVEAAVEQNIQKMKSQTIKETEKAKWKEIMKGYEKHTDFHNKVLKPFENYIAAFISDRRPIKFQMPKGIIKRNYNLVVGMTDLHYLKLCADEAGNIIYDRKIAIKKLFETQKELLSQITMYGIPEKITVLVGSDNIHIDNPLQTTTSGTNLANSTEGIWQLEIGNYISIQLEYIDMFASIAPVEVISIPGNHDKHTAYTMAAFLKVYYEKVNKKVEVIQSLVSNRVYRQYGDRYCLIFEHGDNVSPTKMDKEMHKVIMSEAAAWGIKSAINMVFYHFSGHTHAEDQKDLGGNVIRIVLPVVCPPDMWHSLNQYVGTTLQTMNTLIDIKKGRCAILFT